MKKSQLKRLEKMIEKFKQLKTDIAEATEPHANDLGDAKSQLTKLRDELQEKYDGFSDRVQQSERGEALDAEIASINEADTALENVLEHFRDIDNQIETAIDELREAAGEQ